MATNYTEDDVRTLIPLVIDLVDAAKVEFWNERIIQRVEKALEPFLPDPDAELLSKITELRYTISNYDADNKAIVEAVRSYDAGKV